MNLKRIIPVLLLLGSSVVAGSGSVKNIVVVVGGWESAENPELLGVLSGEQWLEDAAAAKLVKPNQRFRLFSNTGLRGSAQGGNPQSSGAPCEETFNVPIKPMPKAKLFQVGMTASWNPQPRAMTVLPSTSAPYLKIASEFLASKGLKTSSVKLTNVLKVDLDNNKTDEVFLVGRYFKDHDPKSYFPPTDGSVGDYSFVLMRKIIVGKVQTISLGDDVLLKVSTPESENRHLANLYDIAGILDLNGDGKLEVVTYSAYYEGYSFEILEWNGKKFVSRAVSGCGA